jgi:hypothetical protein
VPWGVHAACMPHRSMQDRIFDGYDPGKHTDHVGHWVPWDGNYPILHPGHRWKIDYPMRHYVETPSHGHSNPYKKLPVQIPEFMGMR